MCICRRTLILTTLLITPSMMLLDMVPLPLQRHPVTIFSGFKNRPFSLQFFAMLHDTMLFEVIPVAETDFDLLGIGG